MIRQLKTFLNRSNEMWLQFLPASELTTKQPNGGLTCRPWTEDKSFRGSERKALGPTFPSCLPDTPHQCTDLVLHISSTRSIVRSLKYKSKSDGARNLEVLAHCPIQQTPAPEAGQRRFNMFAKEKLAFALGALILPGWISPLQAIAKS